MLVSCALGIVYGWFAYNNSYSNNANSVVNKQLEGSKFFLQHWWPGYVVTFVFSGLYRVMSTSLVGYRHKISQQNYRILTKFL